MVNKAFLQTIGYPLEEIPTLDHWWPLAYPDPTYRQTVAKAWQNNLHDAKSSGKPFVPLEINIQCKDGSVRTFLASAAPLESDYTGSHLVSLFDVTERKQMEDKVRELAFYDPLTQLPNRRLISDRLGQVMATSMRTGCHGAVMFLDLDNFKPLNDLHGHDVGDQLLIEVANRLKSCIRGTDTVGRFGGDEFLIILSELNANKDSSTTQATIVAEKILSALSVPYQLDVADDNRTRTTVEYRCTASIGVALFLGHEASQEDILKWADSAMYDAKSVGRNSIRFCQASARIPQ